MTHTRGTPRLAPNPGGSANDGARTVKAKLADEFRKLLGARGLSQQQAALRIGVKFTTFRNSLQKNKYDRVWLRDFLRLVDLPIDVNVLRQKYKFDLTAWPGANIELPKFGKLRKSSSEFAKILPELGAALGSVLAEMGTGDGLAFFGREISPKHVTEGKLVVTAADAIIRGVNIVYIRPSHRPLVEMSEQGQYHDVTEDRIKNEFSYFMAAVEERAVALGKPAEVVSSRLALVLVDSLAVFHGNEARAYHRYTTDEPERSEILLARVPIAGPNDEVMPGHASESIEAYLLLSKTEAQRVGDILKRLLGRARRGESDPPGVYYVDSAAPANGTSDGPARNDRFIDSRKSIYDALSCPIAKKETIE